MCGMPTTRKEMARVVVKMESVARERGWSAEGIMGSPAAGGWIELSKSTVVEQEAQKWIMVEERKCLMALL
jgi:hypothetical protein